MAFAGSLISQNIFNFWILVAVGTLGNLTGSLLAYALGYLGEERIPKIFRNKEYHHAVNLFNKYGEIITFVSRILPAIRTYISLPAGIAKMNLKKFVIYTAFGSFLWSAFLTYLGLIMGANWHTLSKYFHYLDFLVIATVFTSLGIFIFKKFRHHGGSISDR